MFASSNEWTSYSSRREYDDDYSPTCLPEPKTAPWHSLFKFHDVSIKVGDQIYPSNRLQLSLESNYFEKLFTENYAGKDGEFVEIRTLDSATFSAIVDIINGKDLESLINADSCVSLLLAMDFLQMEIDLKPFAKYIEKYAEEDLPFNSQMFELCSLAGANQDYKYLRCKIHYYLSRHFLDFLNYQEFLLLSPEELIDIIKIRQRVSRYPCAYEKNIVSRICTKWICHDVEKRLNNFVKLVNAANYRLFKSFFRINADNIVSRLNNMRENENEEEIRRYFYQFLDRNGEINADDFEEPRTIDNGFSTHSKINQIDRVAKWTKCAKEGLLYDVIVKAGKKSYKLHRFVLITASSYFSDLFSAKNDEEQAQSTKSSNRAKIDEYVVDFAESTFDLIVELIYFDSVLKMNSIEESIEILKAGKILKMDKLMIEGLFWIDCNVQNFSIEDILQILDLVLGDDSFSNLNKDWISNFVCKFLSSKSAENLKRDIIHRIWNVCNTLQCGRLTEKCTKWMVRNLQAPTRKDVSEILKNKHGVETILQFLNISGAEKLSVDIVLYILHVSENLKCYKLVKKCLQWMTRHQETLTAENLIEILNFTLEKEEFDYEYAFFLCKHVVASWPNVDESLFCVISDTMLENMILLPDFFFDDPHQIIDICAKWIVHDVKNRYPLIPKIAFDINRNHTANLDDYKITEIPQISDCSQQLIRDKLREILSSNSLVRYSDAGDLVVEKKPIFISAFDWDCVEDFTCDVVDEDLSKIASLKSLMFHFNNPADSDGYHTYLERPLSTTLIKDNLFVLCGIYETSVFLVYNLSSKKLYSLAGIPHITERVEERTLLNCNGQVYCCFGRRDIITRYSVELNRWQIISKLKSETKPILRIRNILFTSDGTNLFRVFKSNVSDSITKCVLQTWDLKQDSWTCLSDVSKMPSAEKAIGLTNVENGIAVLSKSMIFYFDLKSRCWREILPPSQITITWSHDIPLITHCNDGLLYVYNDKLYELNHLQGNWVLKKDSMFKRDLISVVVIHRCIDETSSASQGSVAPLRPAS
ncbi:uncharacterized protein LOC135831300 [Planococcus citri]|uniref:uncharacterized protein LOC135831300 n=1 Tax=Planococcus citri TaxID=170843 RepID=UPI0031F8DCE7